jgi:hypothetical protein
MGTKVNEISDERLLEVLEGANDVVAVAARRAGIPRTTFRRRLAGLREQTKTARSVDELLESKEKIFRNKARMQSDIDMAFINFDSTKPIGILHFGDPHIDDDGCDILSLKRDISLVQGTDGLYAGNLGDTTNSWVGRLARLYAEQTTTGAEAWQLAEWFIDELGEKLLYMVAGNHDLWNGHNDPMLWIMRHRKARYHGAGVRVSLNFPNGESIRINAHHDWSGNSQYNPAHGAMKGAQLGFRDHLLLNGHKHVSGYGIVKCPSTGLVSHCVQVGSYKVIDRYAQEKGFTNLQISPSVLTIIDPMASDAGLVTVFYDTEQGTKALKALRGKA